MLSFGYLVSYKIGKFVMIFELVCHEVDILFFIFGYFLCKNVLFFI